MFSTTLVASLFAVMLSAQGANPPASSAWRLAVATPTYLTDGKVIGATRRFNSLAMNQPLVFYPHSGDSLCQSASATTDEPPDATNGWRVQVVPLRSSMNGVVFQV